MNTQDIREDIRRIIANKHHFYDLLKQRFQAEEAKEDASNELRWRAGRNDRKLSKHYTTTGRSDRRILDPDKVVSKPAKLEPLKGIPIKTAERYSGKLYVNDEVEEEYHPYTIGGDDLLGHKLPKGGLSQQGRSKITSRILR